MSEGLGEVSVSADEVLPATVSSDEASDEVVASLAGVSERPLVEAEDWANAPSGEMKKINARKEAASLRTYRETCGLGEFTEKTSLD